MSNIEFKDGVNVTKDLAVYFDEDRPYVGIEFSKLDAFKNIIFQSLEFEDPVIQDVGDVLSGTVSTDTAGFFSGDLVLTLENNGSDGIGLLVDMSGLQFDESIDKIKLEFSVQAALGFNFSENLLESQGVFFTNFSIENPENIVYEENFNRLIITLDPSKSTFRLDIRNSLKIQEDVELVGSALDISYTEEAVTLAWKSFEVNTVNYTIPDVPGDVIQIPDLPGYISILENNVQIYAAPGVDDSAVDFTVAFSTLSPSELVYPVTFDLTANVLMDGAIEKKLDYVQAGNVKIRAPKFSYGREDTFTIGDVETIVDEENNEITWRMVVPNYSLTDLSVILEGTTSMDQTENKNSPNVWIIVGASLAAILVILVLLWFMSKKTKS